MSDWFKRKPWMAGYWWAKGAGWPPHMIQVKDEGGLLHLYTFQQGEWEPDGLVVDMSDEFRFAGPIDEPDTA